MARAIRSSVRKARRSYLFQNNGQLFELLAAIRWKKHKTLFVPRKIHQPFELVQVVSKKILSLLLSYYAEVCFLVQQTLSSSLSHVRWHRAIQLFTRHKRKKPSNYHLRTFFDWCHWNQWYQWKTSEPISTPYIYLLLIFTFPQHGRKK